MRSRRILGALALFIIAIFMLGNTGIDNNAVMQVGPTIPDPISPAGNIRDRFPRYTWTKEDADLYQVQVKQGATVVYFGTVATSACNPTDCSHEPPVVLDYGDYVWRVRAMVYGSWEPMSAWQSFTVVKPTLKEPTGTIVDQTPRYVWTREEDVTNYQVQVLQGTTTIYTKTTDKTVCGVSNCLITPANVLPLGDYKWRVRTKSDGVWWEWTNGQAFRIIADPSFFSDFNTNMDGWGEVRGNWWIAAGKVLKTEGLSDLLASVYYQDSNFANLRYQVKMKRAATGCTSCATGILIRGGIQPLGSKDVWNKGYFFVYSNSGNYWVIEISGGVMTPLVPMTPSTAINMGGWNTLRVDAIGSGLKFYINNTLVYCSTDITHTIGKIGIAIYNDNSAGNALFVDWAGVSYRNPTTFLPLLDGEMQKEGLPVLDGEALFVAP